MIRRMGEQPFEARGLPRITQSLSVSLPGLKMFELRFEFSDSGFAVLTGFGLGEAPLERQQY